MPSKANTTLIPTPSVLSAGISEQLCFVGAVRFNSSPLRSRGVFSLKGLSGSAERNRRRYLEGELDVPRVRLPTLEGVRLSDIDCVARALFGSLSKRSRPMSSEIQIRGDSKGKWFVRGAFKHDGLS